MGARAISSATISFGLVSIPVKLYSASESSAAVSFNMLHGKDHSRLKQQYICAADGEIVPREDMVKGYEYAKDQYVVFTEEELKALNETSTGAIAIEEFVPAERVDPIYFEGAYYLGPDKGGARPYRLLAEAMRRSGRSALARWSARGKQYLVLVRAVPDGLILQQLRYQDELKPFSEVPIDGAEVKDAEVDLALQIIQQIVSEEFHPEKYEDGVRKAMQAAIQRKIEGKQIEAAPEAPKGQIIDLMEALKASLAARGAAVREAPAPVAADDTPAAGATPSAPVSLARKRALRAERDEESGTEAPARAPRRAASR